MGPCLCGDVCCPWCGNPDAARAADEEQARVEAAIGDTFESIVWCSCGVVIVEALEDPNGSAVYLHRACARCWEEDHFEPDYDAYDFIEEPSEGPF